MPPSKMTPADFREILHRKIKDLDFDPVDEMIGIYKGGDLSNREKIQVCQTVMEYLYPKLKAIDVQHKSDGNITIQILKFSEEAREPKTLSMNQQGPALLPMTPQEVTADIGDDALDEV